MKVADFLYDLPASSIAQEPVEPRDHSRLLVLERASAVLQHKYFSDIIDFLRAGDVLVLNATRVFPARLRGKKRTGGKIEVLLLEPKNPDTTLWRTLVRGATKPTAILFENDVVGTMEERLTEGEWLMRFSRGDMWSYLEEHGEMPLPPYIKRPAPHALDLDRYQTVYADKDGAVAAPTAGFHFTPALLEKIRAKGILVQTIILHVGWGTFRPVRAEKIEDHAMLPEAYDVSEATAAALNKAHQEKRRIVAVGTTAVRTLETVCDEKGVFHPGRGEATLFIYPGYKFKAVDALITNFHLPDSTPLFLACAFYAHQYRHPPRSLAEDPQMMGSPPESAGNDVPNFPFVLKDAYMEAIRQGYRFYSYGDAMLIQ